MWNVRNGGSLKYVFWLTIDHKVVQLSIEVGMAFFITNLSFNLLVKELLKSLNIWLRYGQNGCSCHMPHSPYTFVLKDADLAR